MKASLARLSRPVVTFSFGHAQEAKSLAASPKFFAVRLIASPANDAATAAN